MVFLDLACISTNMTLLLPILIDKNMSRQPSKWLIMNCSIGLMIQGILTISKIHHRKVGDPNATWSKVSGLCEFLEIVHITKVYLVPIAVLQMTIERLVCLLNTNRDHSAFGPKLTLCYMALGWGLSLFFSLMCAFIVGNIYYYENSCYISYPPVSVNFFFILFLSCRYFFGP